MLCAVDPCARVSFSASSLRARTLTCQGAQVFVSLIAASGGLLFGYDLGKCAALMHFAPDQSM
jgi:hypothetical protein